MLKKQLDPGPFNSTPFSLSEKRIRNSQLYFKKVGVPLTHKTQDSIQPGEMMS